MMKKSTYENDLYLSNLIYENTSDMIFLMQRDDVNNYRYLLVNKSFEDIIRIKRENILGKKFGMLIPKTLSERIMLGFEKSVIQREQLKTELEFQLNNEQIFFEATISPVFENDNVKVLVIAHNITDRKNYETELLAAKNLSDESNKLKSALLSNMSHEVRTPLNGIIGFAEILKLETQVSDHNEMLENIIQSSKRLLYTLHSIIELSQLESMSKPVYSNTLKIFRTITDTVKGYVQIAEEKGLNISVDIKNENIEVHIDDYFLTQILHHLLQNAIKFTFEGEIKVELDEIITGSGSFAVINVSDTGIGISTDEQKYIFEKFRQGSEGLNRKNEGSGLGLTLAKTMTEIMGGEITLKSELNRGSCFTLKFPSLFEGQKELHKRISPKAQKGKNKILLVEDNKQNARLISLFLDKQYQLVHVQEASVAVNELINNSYALVLMDINLGNGMNGYDIIKQVRSNVMDFDTPVIAMTGYALNVDKDTLLSNGFDYFLPKPFDKNQLNHIVNECVNNKLVLV
jgi:PAS domain S-box-containing protein